MDYDYTSYQVRTWYYMILEIYTSHIKKIHAQYGVLTWYICFCDISFLLNSRQIYIYINSNSRGKNGTNGDSLSTTKPRAPRAPIPQQTQPGSTADHVMPIDHHPSVISTLIHGRRWAAAANTSTSYVPSEGCSPCQGESP